MYTDICLEAERDWMVAAMADDVLMLRGWKLTSEQTLHLQNTTTNDYHRGMVVGVNCTCSSVNFGLLKIVRKSVRKFLSKNANFQAEKKHFLKNLKAK